MIASVSQPRFAGRVMLSVLENHCRSFFNELVKDRETNTPLESQKLRWITETRVPILDIGKILCNAIVDPWFDLERALEAT
eukprot:13828-Amphidinium_carterae.1